MSGSRLRICLESADQGVVWNVVDPANDFTVTNVSLNLDTTSLSDAITRKLLQETSSNGLTLSFKGYSNAHQRNNLSTANMSAQKSVGRACQVVAVTRKKAFVDAQDQDSLAPEEFKYTEFRTRIGNNTFPDKPITNLSDMYLYTMRTFNEMSKCKDVDLAVSLYDFVGDAVQDKVAIPPPYNSAIATAQLCRSEELAASGLPTNKSQGEAIIDIKYEDSVERDIDVFLLYDQEIVIGVQNLIVEQ
jgi:hypothetical protein